MIRATVTLCLLSACLFAQSTLNVPGTHATIQSAINAAAPGDTVLVAPGTYNELVDFGGKDITVKSSAGAGVTTIDGGAGGTVVTFQSGETAAAVLEGFTVTNGLGGPVVFVGTTNYGRPGGIWCVASSPTIRACTITGNQGAFGNNSGNDGCGGIDCWNGSQPLIENCTITNNTGGGFPGPGGVGTGGVRFAINSAGTVRNCVISNNGGPHHGAVACILSDALIEDCVMDNNAGAGAWTTDSTATFRRCTISNSGAVGFHCTSIFQSNLVGPTLENCTIFGNTGRNGFGFGAVEPGGIRSTVVSSVITGCVVYGNTGGDGVQFLPMVTTTGGAGGIGVVSGSAIVTNCTVADNVGGNGAGAPAGSGGMNLTGGAAATVTNSIFWGNTLPNGSFDQFNGTPSVTFSDVMGGFAGVGNFDANPGFVSPAGGDYHVLPSTPCLDAGTGTAPGLAAEDLDGDPRVFPTAPDVGADEVVRPCWHGSVGVALGAPAPVPLLFVNGASLVAGIPLNQAITLEMQQPATNPNPADFILWAHFGAPSPVLETAFAWGTFCVPFNVAPLASSFLPGTGIIPATQTPFVFVNPGLPFPIAFTIQGVVVQSNLPTNNVAVTNAVYADVQ